MLDRNPPRLSRSTKVAPYSIKIPPLDVKNLIISEYQPFLDSTGANFNTADNKQFEVKI